MSFGRLALRLATIEALRPHASLISAGAWPTIAQHRVYDAMIDTIDDLAAETKAPVISVYTDEDQSVTHQSGPPFERATDLILELSVVQLMEDPNDPAAYEPAIPVTDAETEASLDLLEASIKFALLYGPTGTIWRKLTGNRVAKVRSLPSRTGEEAIRLAQRTVTISVEIDDDCYDLAPSSVATGLDRLPQPLRDIAKALPDGSYGRRIADALALSAPTSAVPLSSWGVNSGFDFHSPPDPQAPPDVIVTADIPQT